MSVNKKLTATARAVLYLIKRYYTVLAIKKLAKGK